MDFSVSVKGRPDVLALACRVNYWDSLGWPDRFASPEATLRQRGVARLARSHSVYTPQVVVQGRDWTSWPQLPEAPAPAAVGPTLTRLLTTSGAA